MLAEFLHKKKEIDIILLKEVIRIDFDLVRKYNAYTTVGINKRGTASHRDNKINLLKRTGYVMHQQFNIQQLYVLSTLYLCVLYLSENKQRLVPLTP